MTDWSKVTLYNWYTLSEIEPATLFFFEASHQSLLLSGWLISINHPFPSSGDREKSEMPVESTYPVLGLKWKNTFSRCDICLKGDNCKSYIVCFTILLMVGHSLIVFTGVFSMGTITAQKMRRCESYIVFVVVACPKFMKSNIVINFDVIDGQTILFPFFLAWADRFSSKRETLCMLTVIFMDAFRGVLTFMLNRARFTCWINVDGRPWWERALPQPHAQMNAQLAPFVTWRDVNYTYRCPSRHLSSAGGKSAPICRDTSLNSHQVPTRQKRPRCHWSRAYLFLSKIKDSNKGLKRCKKADRRSFWHFIASKMNEHLSRALAFGRVMARTPKLKCDCGC